MKYDQYIKSLTKKVNNINETNWTNKEVHIAMQYKLTVGDLLERFIDYHADYIRYNADTNNFEIYAKIDGTYRFKWYNIRYSNLKQLLRVMITDAVKSAEIITDVQSAGELSIELDVAKYHKDAVEFARFYSGEIELSAIVELLKERFIKEQELITEAKRFR